MLNSDQIYIRLKAFYITTDKKIYIKIHNDIALQNTGKRCEF